MFPPSWTVSRQLGRLGRIWGVLRSYGLLAMLMGCVGSGEGLPDAASSSEVPRTYEEIQLMIFDPLCASSCHKGGAAPQGLSLEAGQSHSALFGMASQEVPSMLRVAPGQPEESYLITKVVQSDGRRAQLRMPRNGPPWLTNGQVRALKRWISAGAKNDWIDQDIDAGTVPIIDAGTLDADASDEPIDASSL